MCALSSMILPHGQCTNTVTHKFEFHCRWVVPQLWRPPARNMSDKTMPAPGTFRCSHLILDKSPRIDDAIHGSPPILLRRSTCLESLVIAERSHTTANSRFGRTCNIRIDFPRKLQREPPKCTQVGLYYLGFSNACYGGRVPFLLRGSSLHGSLNLTQKLIWNEMKMQPDHQSHNPRKIKVILGISNVSGSCLGVSGRSVCKLRRKTMEAHYESCLLCERNESFHACYGGGSTVWLNIFQKNGAPSPKVIGDVFGCVATLTFVYLAHGSAYRVALFRSIKNQFFGWGIELLNRLRASEKK